MQEGIEQELEEINTKLVPVLNDILTNIDIKTAIIYFSGLTKNLLEELDDNNFNEVIVRYITDGLQDGD